jgi:hypothetical protein
MCRKKFYQHVQPSIVFDPMRIMSSYNRSYMFTGVDPLTHVNKLYDCMHRVQLSGLNKC